MYNVFDVNFSNWFDFWLQNKQYSLVIAFVKIS